MNEDLNKQLEYLKEILKNKSTICSLVFSAGFLEKDYPVISEFLMFLYRQEINSFTFNSPKLDLTYGVSSND